MSLWFVSKYPFGPKLPGKREMELPSRQNRQSKNRKHLRLIVKGGTMELEKSSGNCQNLLAECTTPVKIFSA